MANVVTIVPAAQRTVPVYTSAARTATPDTQQFNLDGRYPQGLVVVVDMTVFTATGTLTVKVEGVDTVSGKTYTLIQSAALAAAATTVLRVDPNLTTSGTVTSQDIIPPVIRVTATHGNAVALTYSISAMLTG